MTLDAFNVGAVEAKLLCALGRDGDILDPECVFHIGFDGFAGYDVAVHAELVRQFFSERDAFCFGRQDVVRAGGDFFGEFVGAGTRQAHVAEHDKAGDCELVIDVEYRQVAFAACDV